MDMLKAEPPEGIPIRIGQVLRREGKTHVLGWPHGMQPKQLPGAPC